MVEKLTTKELGCQNCPFSETCPLGVLIDSEECKNHITKCMLEYN